MSTLTVATVNTNSVTTDLTLKTANTTAASIVINSGGGITFNSNSTTNGMFLSTSARFTINGILEFSPGASVTPTNNGDVVFELTNNTTLTIRARGSDGTVRSGTVALS